MATKKTSTTEKKTTPTKKTDSTAKKTTVKKTRVVKKEISPIVIESSEVVNSIDVSKKTSSVEGLREAITEAKKREALTSKPVVKKISDIVASKEESVKKDVYKNNEFFEDRATYKKDEITKKPELNDNNPKIFSIEDDAGKESATEKAKRLIDEFNEIKKSPLEQIEKKPATPYKMPEPMVRQAKRKNPVAMLLAGIVVVIACVSFFVFKNVSGRKDELASSNPPDDTLVVEQVGSDIQNNNEDLIIPESEVLTPSSNVVPAVELTSAIETKRYTIQKGNTLAIIAKNELGDDKRWPTIFAMNEKVLVSPDNFEPLTVINIPTEKKLLSAMTALEKKNLYDDYMKVVDYYQRNNKQKEVTFYKNKALEFYKP